MTFIDEVAVANTATSFFEHLGVWGVGIVEDLATMETTINHLRNEMVRTYEKVGDLVDETVIALSQQLDVYLLKFQQHTRVSESK
jgi:hypothetical protein